MTDVSWNTILQLSARHVLTAIGLWLAKNGYIDASATEGFVGAGMMILGVAWSLWEKKGHALALAEATRAYESAAAQLRAFRKPPAASVTKP